MTVKKLLQKQMSFVKHFVPHSNFGRPLYRSVTALKVPVIMTAVSHQQSGAGAQLHCRQHCPYHYRLFKSKQLIFKVTIIGFQLVRQQTCRQTELVITVSVDTVDSIRWIVNIRHPYRRLELKAFQCANVHINRNRRMK